MDNDYNYIINKWLILFFLSWLKWLYILYIIKRKIKWLLLSYIDIMYIIVDDVIEEKFLLNVLEGYYYIGLCVVFKIMFFIFVK